MRVRRWNWRSQDDEVATGAEKRKSTKTQGMRRWKPPSTSYIAHSLGSFASSKLGVDSRLFEGAGPVRARRTIFSRAPLSLAPVALSGLGTTRQRVLNRV